MSIDHVNVKLYATPDSTVNWPGLIPVFHRWIRESVLPGTLIDVADYAHVPEGPGILLIAHEAFYSVDNRRNQPGFLYNRRTPAEGSDIDKVRDAWMSAADSASKLELEAGMDQLRFERQRFEVAVNDRVLAPNTSENADRLGQLVSQVYAERFGQK